jgi:tRNA dimethylallyltransferase
MTAHPPEPPRIVVVTGPTASGKTALGIKVALAVGGDVVNADSQQVYRGMEVGTAQPTRAEMKGVPHHLFGVVDPKTEFDAACYAKLADAAIRDVFSSGKSVVLVGGTQLYIRALEKGLAEMPEIPSEVRLAVKKAIAESGPAAAHRRLEGVDPQAAARITPADAQRIQRALEVYETTGVRISEFQRAHGFAQVRYRCLKIAIRVPRGELHRRIEERTIRLFETGFAEEVGALLASGCAPELRSFKAHGYRHVADAISGRITMERAMELTARDTRRYARRQETWLRSDRDVRWVDWPECPGAEDMARAFLGIDPVREAAE